MRQTDRRGIEHRLLQLGVGLFLGGLLTGLGMPLYASPRLGLSSHLEGVLNGIVLVGLGLLWPKLRLGACSRVLLFSLAVYGAYANWLTTLLAAFWGAGGTMMPLAGAEQKGTSVQEAIVMFGLLSLTVSMLVVSVMVLWGLRVSGMSSVSPGSAIADSVADQEETCIAAFSGGTRN